MWCFTSYKCCLVPLLAIKGLLFYEPISSRILAYLIYIFFLVVFSFFFSFLTLLHSYDTNPLQSLLLNWYWRFFLTCSKMSLVSELLPSFFVACIRLLAYSFYFWWSKSVPHTFNSLEDCLEYIFNRNFLPNLNGPFVIEIINYTNQQDHPCSVHTPPPHINCISHLKKF